MSRALSFGNGRAKPTKEMMVLPFALISKVPLRGFSSLILTVATPFSAASILAARVLKAPQDLQASMVTMDLPALVEPFVGAAALGAAFAFLAIVFLGAILRVSEASFSFRWFRFWQVVPASCRHVPFWHDVPNTGFVRHPGAQVRIPIRRLSAKTRLSSLPVCCLQTVNSSAYKNSNLTQK